MGEAKRRGTFEQRQADAIKRFYEAARREARKPLPPEVLAGAYQDRVHVDKGRTRPGISNRTIAAMLAVTTGTLDK